MPTIAHQSLALGLHGVHDVIRGIYTLWHVGVGWHVERRDQRL